ncbi:hypothetical protein GCM10022224_078220 [Nonomuraea antimicrobica]|uniref:Transposase IS4-like domain-containing protein n=2 Tax=Nonomuraea antimicrobica TaxID=561173 RepID=A0ABP7D4Q3_9ACTN
MAIDGFVVDVPDTEANVAEFGRDSAGGYETAFPQARMVAISECASHTIVAADAAGCWAGEQTLAFSLYRRLTEEMLLTADRGFYSFPAWNEARDSGAHLSCGGSRLDCARTGCVTWRTGPGSPSSPNPLVCGGRRRTDCARPPARAETSIPTMR